MSKLIGKAKNSKLHNSLQNDLQNSPTKEKIVRQVKPKEYPRSYRIDAEVMNVLKNTLDRINECSPRKVSEARLIKALIMLSKEVKNDRIIKALKEIW
jgi:hypothetical protein